VPAKQKGHVCVHVCVYVCVCLCVCVCVCVRVCVCECQRSTSCVACMHCKRAFSASDTSLWLKMHTHRSLFWEGIAIIGTYNVLICLNVIHTLVWLTCKHTSQPRLPVTRPFISQAMQVFLKQKVGTNCVSYTAHEPSAHT